MPSWRKLIQSGSDAALNSLFVSTDVTASSFSVPGGLSTGFLKADGTIDSSSYSTGEPNYTKTVNQASHGLSVTNAIRHNGAIYVAAQANTASNAGTIGVVSQVVDPNNFIFQYSGFLATGSWTPGVAYFLSTGSAGAIVPEPTYQVGEVREYVGTGTPDGLLLEFDVGDVIATPTAGGSGTVTSVSGTGTVNGITLSGTVTSAGSLTLGGTFSATTSSISNFNTGVQTIVDSNNVISSSAQIASITGSSLITASAALNVITFTKGDSSTFNVTINTGSGGGSGTVTSVGGQGTVSGLTLTGIVTTSGSLTLGGTFTETTSSISNFNTGVQSIINSNTLVSSSAQIVGWSKSLFVESPTATDDIGIWITDRAITITEVRTWVRGTGTPTVTFNITHGTDPTSVTVTDLWSTDQTANTTTSVQAHSTTFNDNTCAAGEAIRFVASAVGGTTQTGIQVTIFYTID